MTRAGILIWTGLLGCHEPVDPPVDEPEALRAPILRPTAPTSVDALYIEGPDATAAYVWFVDGVQAGTGTSLPPQVRGVEVSAVATRADTQEEAWSLEPRTIGNAAPTVSVTLSPVVPTTADALVATLTTEDADGDTVVASWRWWADGAELPVAGPSLPAAGIPMGTEVQVRVLVEDGFGGTTTALASVTIGNAPPPVPRVRLEPDHPVHRLDNLVCVVEAEEDPDGDALTFGITWTRNGAPWVPGTLPILNTVVPGDTVPWQAMLPGDTWSCAATSDDGTSSSARATSSDGVIGERVFVDIATRSNAVCGLRSDGELECIGKIWPQSAGVKSWDLPGGGYTQLATDAAGTLCGLRSDQTWTCAPGSGITGGSGGPALAIHHRDEVLLAVRPDGELDEAGWRDDLPEGPFVDVRLRDDRSACALDAGGELTCFGNWWTEERTLIDSFSDVSSFAFANSNPRVQMCVIYGADGQIACESTGADPTLETNAPAGTGWTQLVADPDANGACALHVDGTVACWGADAPVLAPWTGAKPKRIAYTRAAGLCAVTEDGALRCVSGNHADDWFPDHAIADVVLNLSAPCTRDRVDGWRCHNRFDLVPDGLAVDAPRPVLLADGAQCGLSTLGEVVCSSGLMTPEGLPPGPYVAFGGADVGIDRTVFWALTPGGVLTGDTWMQSVLSDITWPGPLAEVGFAEETVCGRTFTGTVVCHPLHADGPDLAPEQGTTYTALSRLSSEFGLRADGTLDAFRAGSPGRYVPAGLFKAVAAVPLRACALSGDGAITCWFPSSGALMPSPVGAFHEVLPTYDGACGLTRSGRLVCRTNSTDVR